MSRVALITGGTAGIGLSTAMQLGEEGYFVYINGHNKERGEAALSQLQEKGIQAEFLNYDASSEQAVIAAIEKIEAQQGKLDVLVNNAGGLVGRNAFEGMTTEFYRQVIGLNLDSVFFHARACITLLKKGEAASIVNLTSIAGWNGGGPGAGMYSVSKAAVTTMTRSLAKELAKYGIRVNGVSPGTIDTAFHAATDRNLLNSWKEGILLKRLGESDEVAKAICFLASEDASYITGEIIHVNGGQAFL